ncbi:MAG: protein-disulfide reductase DsbD domain-containing protein [Pseudomonadota bacterium]
MKVLSLTAIAAAIISLVGIDAASGRAAAAERVVTEHSVSVLEAAADGVAPGGEIDVVLRQELQEGWHVYWRNPGDTGLPLEFAWDMPAGFEAGDIEYPAPERIRIGDFVNYGHHGAPAFVTTLTAPADAAPGETARFGLTATWLICEEICVPESGEFELTLPIVEAPRPVAEVAAYVEELRAAAPTPWPGEARVHAGPDGPILVLSAEEHAPDLSAGSFHFFADEELMTIPAAAQTAARSGDGLTVVRLAGGDAYDGDAYDGDGASRLTGLLAVGDGAGRRDYRVVAEAASGPAPAVAVSAVRNGTGAAGLLGLLAFAFLGGAILNAMPCVFPIIFVKAASFVGAASEDHGKARRHGVIYALGAVATFAVLGGVLLALRAGGEQLGWGFHLQSPVLVAASAYVLFLVGLNLAGVFEFGTSLQSVGSGLASKSGDLGAFFTGALAVFVAAPCVGPFLSAPLGAAVLLPPALGMLIFIAMALGLAAPYLAISFWPALARRLPKPGPWMTVFKQALAFPVFGAAAYFVWILSRQVSGDGLAIAFGVIIILAIAAWLFGMAQRTENPRMAGRLSAAALAVAVFAIAPTIGLSNAAPSTTATTGGYGRLEAIAFDAAEVSARASDRGVFVDFTAAWCVVCQFNKRTVLARGDIAALFEKHGVTLMSADWTRRDPLITEALAGFGANGVPLYVYYPPNGADPIVLPLPLSGDDIKQAVLGGAPATLAIR